jgi:hypothetical protein
MDDNTKNEFGYGGFPVFPDKFDDDVLGNGEIPDENLYLLCDRYNSATRLYFKYIDIPESPERTKFLSDVEEIQRDVLKQIFDYKGNTLDGVKARAGVLANRYPEIFVELHENLGDVGEHLNAIISELLRIPFTPNVEIEHEETDPLSCWNLAKNLPLLEINHANVDASYIASEDRSSKKNAFKRRSEVIQSRILATHDLILETEAHSFLDVAAQLLMVANSLDGEDEPTAKQARRAVMSSFIAVCNLANIDKEAIGFRHYSLDFADGEME